MIEINKLTKRYGQIEAVKNISFAVHEGEILGFLGPNGAGKSTTMNIITGYLPATEGSVKVAGFDILEEPEEVKKRIGFMPEQPPVFKDMTVWEYLRFVSDLKYVPKNKQKSQLDDIMELCGITDHRNRLINNLSKGYKQRVGLAQSLIGNPQVLILDEPTVGLDPRQIIEIRNLIKSLGKNHTIILSSHILPEVQAICERVVIINKGEIAAIDTPENLSKGLNRAAKLTATIAGPQNQVSKLINDIYGVKYSDVLSKPGKDTVTYVIEADKDIDIRRPLFFAMAKAGYPIIELKSMDMTLEDIFLKVITVEEEVH
ncbi:MAG: ABC transporter ATP-binding protein [Clostridia bacterium]|nr:ATP-binding cassette domain-containing protein [Clostridiaceae bacterium]